jgi:hypothetical protein
VVFGRGHFTRIAATDRSSHAERASVHPKSGCRVGRNMIWIDNGLVALVAALHVYFLVLEMFLWTKPLGLKTFATRRRKQPIARCLPPIRGSITDFSPPAWSGGWCRAFRRSRSRSRCFPALRHRRRGLWRRHREPPDSICAGSPSRARANSALAGIVSLTLRAGIALQCSIGSSSILRAMTST